MPAQPDLSKVSVRQFAEQFRGEMIPLNNSISYFCASLPMSEEDLRDYLEEELFKRIPNISRNGDPERRVPNIANLNFDHVEGEGLQISLDLKGVAVSTGSACASGSTEPSHVLTAIGLPRDSGYGSLRFSIGKYNTREDVDYTLEILQTVVEKLRKLSPAAAKKQIAN